MQCAADQDEAASRQEAPEALKNPADILQITTQVPGAKATAKASPSGRQRREVGLQPGRTSTLHPTSGVSGEMLSGHSTLQPQKPLHTYSFLMHNALAGRLDLHTCLLDATHAYVMIAKSDE